ncbi:hypothetical protein ES703_30150 [subsurface metagenome]
MNAKQMKLFREEILRALRDGPKTTHQIYGILKRECPKYCNDTKKHFGSRLMWKHRVNNLMYSMQKELLIYLDKGANVWRIVE